MVSLNHLKQEIERLLEDNHNLSEELPITKTVANFSKKSYKSSKAGLKELLISLVKDFKL